MFCFPPRKSLNAFLAGVFAHFVLARHAGAEPCCKLDCFFTSYFTAKPSISASLSFFIVVSKNSKADFAPIANLLSSAVKLSAAFLAGHAHQLGVVGLGSA
jgi:hypothetical protein